MALTLAQIEIIVERNTREIGTLESQVAALQIDNESLRLRVQTLENEAAFQSTAMVESIAKLVACMNHYGDKFFRVESQQAVVSAPKQPWQEVQ